MMFTLMAVYMCYTINAQDDKQTKNKIKFGVKAGANFANASGNGLDFLLNSDPDARIGFTIGGLAEYEISDAFSLQGELTYGQKGFYEKIPGDYEATVKLDYINIPILAKYYVAEGFSIEAGPELSFLLSAKFAETDLDNNEAYDDEDIKEFFKSTDIGLNFGLGYQLDNGIGINARYILGLANIYDYSFETIGETKRRKDDEIGQNLEIKNKVFQISIFYTF